MNICVYSSLVFLTFPFTWKTICNSVFYPSTFNEGVRHTVDQLCVTPKQLINCIRTCIILDTIVYYCGFFI